MTLDDKRYLLASIAKRYVRFGRYEMDELINEAWLSKHVRVAKDTSILWMAGNWAMQNYMKRQEKRMQKQNQRK